LKIKSISVSSYIARQSLSCKLAELSDKNKNSWTWEAHGRNKSAYFCFSAWYQHTIGPFYCILSTQNDHHTGIQQPTRYKTFHSVLYFGFCLQHTKIQVKDCCLMPWVNKLLLMSSRWYLFWTRPIRCNKVTRKQ
jgi:hypothetical protein